MDRAELEGLDRERLVARAEAAGVRRARILTRPEIVDELLRLDPRVDEASLRRARGFFGRARDLLSKVVERGLHLPDAIDRIRASGPLPATVPRTDVQAVPTVTLAEIYAAQGHKERAIQTLRRVLDREPDHGAARALLARLEDRAYVAPPPPLPPEAEVEPEPVHADGEHANGDAELAEGDTDRPAAKPTELAPAPEMDPPPDPFLDDPDVTRIMAQCVAVPLEGGDLFVWWQGATPRGGRFVVRLAVVTPSWNGPTTEIRDIDAHPSSAELLVRGLPASAVVRVAVGTVTGERFTALACSPALEPSRARSKGLVRWTLGGVVPVAPDDPIVARARGAARRG
jgi:Tetratricopeptide repeat